MTNPTKPDHQTTAAVTLDDLAAEQAFSIGATVGNVLANGLPADRALATTAALAEFVRRGSAAQRAVDKILANERRDD